ncbi:MAG: helix-turn-helix domain-containing protein [Thermus sp.]|nr:helix-turn-helix domain-containing protein [Thermus sp.]
MVTPLLLNATEQEKIRALLSALRPGEGIFINDQALPLTPNLVQVLQTYLEPLARGEPVVVVPLEAQLTTQQAADLLGVSRPYLIRLLEEGRIPYQKVGTHRRIKARDLLEYKERRRKEGERILQKLAEEDQELGLGY